MHGARDFALEPRESSLWPSKARRRLGSQESWDISIKIKVIQPLEQCSKPLLIDD